VNIPFLTSRIFTGTRSFACQIMQGDIPRGQGRQTAEPVRVIPLTAQRRPAWMFVKLRLGPG
jgi:hypothetical protein